MSIEKVAEGFYKFDEMEYPSENVSVNMRVDRIDGEYLDTEVDIKGRFSVAGSRRVEFIKKLGELVEEFRI